MTDLELLEQCKIGLGQPVANTAIDGTLTQKINTVKLFMKNAGVSDLTLSDPQTVGVIVIGVTDIWSLDGGKIKYSEAFLMFVNQLAG